MSSGESINVIITFVRQFLARHDINFADHEELQKLFQKRSETLLDQLVEKGLVLPSSTDVKQFKQQMDKTTSPSFTWANFFWRLSIGSNDAFSFDSKSNQQHYMRHLVQLELHPVITSCNDAIDRCNDTTRAAIAEAQADRDNEKVSSIVPPDVIKLAEFARLSSELNQFCKVELTNRKAGIEQASMEQAEGIADYSQLQRDSHQFNMRQGVVAQINRQLGDWMKQ